MKNSVDRFSDRVESYIRYRPGYPQELLDYLFEACNLDKDSSVADIGSGTGIFTRLLLDKQLWVSAVEPNAEMRQAAEAQLAEYHAYKSISGTAEATQLQSSSIDLITVAQAFHWFDWQAAMAEFKRILKPEGKLALVWNRRDLGDPFQQAYENMLVKLAPEYGLVNHMNIEDEKIRILFSVNSFRQKTFRYTQNFDCEGFLGRMQSSSYSPTTGSDELAELNQAAVALFDKFEVNGKISFEYCSHIYLGQPGY